MKKKFEFNGKLNRGGRTYNITAVVNVELTENNVFTASADLKWYQKWFGMAGQCLEELNKIIDDPTYKTIYRMWKSYHLNDMHPGTEKQEEALTNGGYTAWASNYTECCNYLESIGLLEDNGYKFGTGWLKREIPEEDLQIIKGLLQ
ncbi:MAG: hypothetical protein IKF82_01425 [Bacilli bacterium]|nr:hypothetical protein [Bacilli bacterium]